MQTLGGLSEQVAVLERLYSAGTSTAAQCHFASPGATATAAVPATRPYLQHTSLAAKAEQDSGHRFQQQQEQQQLSHSSSSLSIALDGISSDGALSPQGSSGVESYISAGSSSGSGAIGVWADAAQAADCAVLHSIRRQLRELHGLY